MLSIKCWIYASDIWRIHFSWISVIEHILPTIGGIYVIWRVSFPGPNCPGPNCPGAQLSGAQLSILSGRTVGPRTIGPRGPTVRGPIVHFFKVDIWAPDSRAPGPSCPGPRGPTAGGNFTRWPIIFQHKGGTFLIPCWRMRWLPFLYGKRIYGQGLKITIPRFSWSCLSITLLECRALY